MPKKPKGAMARYRAPASLAVLLMEACAPGVIVQLLFAEVESWRSARPNELAFCCERSKKTRIAAKLNARPRKRLDFQTPEECCVPGSSVLHYKLEIKQPALSGQAGGTVRP